MPSTPRVLLWALPSQVQIVDQAIAAARLSIVAAGGPTPEAGADLARGFGVERFDDLRQALQRDDFDLLWLAAPESVDADTRRMIAERGIDAISIEPQLGTLAEVGDEDAAATSIAFAPRMAVAPGFLAATDVLGSFGEVQCVSIFFRSGPDQGTLFARLFDAMGLLHAICGPIERINAGLAGSLPAVPEDLSQLRGHMTVNVRFKSNRCACLALSDSAGAWFRGVTLLGEGGCLRIHDNGFDWIGRDGRIVESHKDPPTPTVGDLIGREMVALLDNRGVAQPPTDDAQILASCEAARLSCLTGQDESPAKLVEMLARP